MSADGYLTDVGYTAGFYREMAPAHIAFAAVLAGFAPGRALRPERVLELGFGQGFGLALLAAANPDIAFEGCDVNREHVENARRLGDQAALANLDLRCLGFDAAAIEGEQDVDIITIHGVMSWVSPSTQDAILAIVRRRLRPGGFVYVSYNAMPGWAPLAPLRDVVMEVKQRHSGGSGQQIAFALDLLAQLRRGQSHYFAANPAAAQHFDSMLTMDRRYLAHEYLGEHSQPLRFTQAAAQMSTAELTFVGTATLTVP